MDNSRKSLNLRHINSLNNLQKYVNLLSSKCDDFEKKLKFVEEKYTNVIINKKIFCGSELFESRCDVATIKNACVEITNMCKKKILEIKSMPEDDSTNDKKE